MNQYTQVWTKWILSLPVLLVIGAITACLPQDMQENTGNVLDVMPVPDVISHETYSNQMRIGPEWSEPKGIGVGFVFPGDWNLPPERRPQNVEIFLPNEQSSMPFLFLQSSEPVQVLITVLLDYQQIPFTLDRQSGLLHKVNVEPGGDLILPFDISFAKPGIHDLTVLVFANPYETSLNPNELMTRGTQLVGRRAVVIVENPTEVHNSLPFPMYGVPVPSTIDINLGVSFAAEAVNPNQHPSERQLYVGNGLTGDIFPFQIWASNLDGDAGSDYAFVLFQNFHQVPANGNYTNVVHLEPDEEKVIDAYVRLSNKPGIEQLQVVYVFDPYKSILRNEVRAPFVFGSQRIAISATNP